MRWRIKCCKFKLGLASRQEVYAAYKRSGLPIPGVSYSSNNSGGRWWLNDDNWRDLEAAGWIVRWIREVEYYEGAERLLGALAMEAFLPFSTLDEALESFIDITGEDPDDAGCSCCGRPHDFAEVQNEPY